MEKLNERLALIANIGVIAGVLFVGWEIQQNTEQMRADVAHNLMASFRDAGEPLTDKSNAEMFFRGFSGLENLTASERYQFNNICAKYFRVAEEAYLHYHAGRLEDTYWQSLAGQHHMSLTVPGIRQTWKETADNYNQAFKVWGDSLLIE